MPVARSVAVPPARGVFKAPVRRNPGVTVSVKGLLVVPLAEAVICVVPGSKAMAIPLLGLMVATGAALLAQVKAIPETMFPLESFAVAVKEAVPLTAIEADVEVTAIEAILGPPELELQPPSMITVRKQSKAGIR
jgi:hypothetical protein